MNYPYHPNSKIEITQVNDTRISKARYYRNRARGNRASYYMISITSPSLPYDQYMELCALYESLEDGLEIFKLPNPLRPLAAFSGHTVESATQAGLKQINIDTNEPYKVGDFIQFDNHVKVYRIAGVLVDGAILTITLACPLYTSVPANTLVKYGADVEFQCSLLNEFRSTINANKSDRGVIDVELIEQA
ncbi:hypothetical protein [Glaciecola sp. KUL10]|uniref:hypothetical protein n=1 Tax=Glaciecola sp. (strain KUL10) TaxID=2161813 RepID=UPI000D786026|nr:hypothetical protein [Glaciecola sp. KUL10]GBL02928.1 hypothetical protein KUL10_02010 [Glaciecola sp. KUL10]